MRTHQPTTTLEVASGLLGALGISDQERERADEKREELR